MLTSGKRKSILNENRVLKKKYKKLIKENEMENDRKYTYIGTIATKLFESNDIYSEIETMEYVELNVVKIDDDLYTINVYSVDDDLNPITSLGNVGSLKEAEDYGHNLLELTNELYGLYDHMKNIEPEWLQSRGYSPHSYK